MNKKLVLMAIVAAVALCGCGEKREFYEAEAPDQATVAPTETGEAVFEPTHAEVGPKVLVEEQGVKIVATSVDDDKINLAVTNDTGKDIAITGEGILLNGIECGGALEAAVPAGSKDMPCAIQFDPAMMVENNVDIIGTVDLKINVNAGEESIIATDSKTIMAIDL